MKWWSLLPGILGISVALFGVLGALLLQSFSHPFVVTHLGIGLFGILCSIPAWRRRRARSSQYAGRGRRFLSDSLPALLGVFGCLLALNIWVHDHNVRIDTSAQGVNVLSKELQTLLSTMDGSLRLHVVKLPGVVSQEKVFHLLERIQAQGAKKVQVSYLDPIADSPRLASLGLRDGMLLSLQYQDDAGTRSAALTHVDEEGIFNELRSLISPEKRVVYVVQGHGEPGLSDKSPEGLLAVKTLLEERGVTVKPLTLSHLDTLPEDMSALIVPAQEQGLLASEQALIQGYVQNGGRAYIALDPLASDFYYALVEGLGIEVKRGVILDKANDAVGSNEVGWHVVARPADGHQILRGFSGDDGVSLSFSLAFSVSKEQQKERAISPLLVSSSSAWLETDLAALLSDAPSASFDEAQDVQGPLPLVLAIQHEEGGRVLVSGDVDWLRNGNMSAYHNAAFADVMIDWLSSHREMVQLPRRQYAASRVLIDRASYHLILLLSFLLPELLLLCGLFAWWRRRWWEPQVSETAIA